VLTPPRGVLGANSSWPPIRRTRAYESVLAWAEEQILRGRLKVGDWLPSERELVETLGVSRASVREALRVLETLGVVVSQAGSGRDSGSIITSVPSDAIGTILRLHLALAQFSLDEVVETRTVIERSAVAAAATRATEADLTELGQILAAMDVPGLEPQEFNKLDTDFHVRVATASHNALLSQLMQALRDSVEREMVLGFENVPDWRPVAVRLRKEHANILKSIANRDPNAASDAVECHISNFYRTAMHG